MVKSYELDEFEERSILAHRAKKAKTQAPAPEAPAPAPKALEVEEDREIEKSLQETEEYEYKCSSCQHEFNGKPEKCPNCQEALEW